MKGTYSYNPEKLSECGKDLMRFELGDTMTDGKEKTCALTDEEYTAVLARHRSWKRAKLACIESIFRRFAYETDTQTGALELQFGERARLWQEEYERTRAMLSKNCLSAEAASALGSAGRAPYFYTGMMSTGKEEG